jgi:hypothetical protein
MHSSVSSKEQYHSSPNSIADNFIDHTVKFLAKYVFFYLHTFVLVNQQIREYIDLAWFILLA